jgi:hypothetical protein
VIGVGAGDTAAVTGSVTYGCKLHDAMHTGLPMPSPVHVKECASCLTCLLIQAISLHGVRGTIGEAFWNTLENFYHFF